MEALARSGRQASALSAYATVRARLAEDLGTSPSEETETLHTAILLGELAGIRREPGARWPPPGRPARADRHHRLAGRPGRPGPNRAGSVRRARGRSGHRQVAAPAALDGPAGRPGHRRRLGVVRRAGPGAAPPARPRRRGGAPPPGRRDGRCPGPGRGRPGSAPRPVVRTAGVMRGSSCSPIPGPAWPSSSPRCSPSSAARPSSSLWCSSSTTSTSPTPPRSPGSAQSARRLADTAVVTIVAGQRTEEGVSFPGATTLALGPLTLADTEALVGPDRAGTLHARSGGHPLFLVELAAADDGDALPATIKEAVAERCARAGPAAATLRAAAVMGPAIDLDLLAAVTATAPSTLLDHLEEGVRRRFLVEEGQAFVFAHALIREAMVSTVSAARAAFLHRQAGRALGARPHVDPLVVAHHARLGGDLEFASAMLVDAARLAVARFDQDEAMRSVGRGGLPGRHGRRPTGAGPGGVDDLATHAGRRRPRGGPPGGRRTRGAGDRRLVGPLPAALRGGPRPGRPGGRRSRRSGPPLRLPGPRGVGLPGLRRPPRRRGPTRGGARVGTGGGRRHGRGLARRGSG